MSRAPIWKAIAETLRNEIAEGHYRPGDRLPTEAELSLRFGVNRHTLRHAIASLVADGVLRSRRGSGVFVTSRPTEYPLGRRVRFQQNVEASGRSPSRKLTALQTRLPDPKEAAALALPLTAQVHVVEGISYVDEQPVAVFRSVFDAARFPEFLQHMAEKQTVTAALSACGLTDYTRSETKLTAKAASAMLALALHIPEGAPILRSVAIDVDTDGRAVEFGTTWFAGDRVTLSVTPDSLSNPR